MSDHESIATQTEWQPTALSDLFSVSSGEGLSQAAMRPGQYPVYGGNGITGFHDAYLYEDKRLIIGRVGEYCGNVFVTRPHSWITDNALITTFYDKSAHLPFWFYFLNHLRLNDFAFAAAQPVITGGILKRLTIRIPALPQQRKIARILTTVDNLIEKTEALIAKYQAIKQGMMHDLFTRGVDEHGHLRPAYEEAPELYKQSELGWIPKEWEVAVLGDEIGPIVSGWSPVCDSIAAAMNEWAILKTTAVVWEGYDESENKRLPDNFLPTALIEVKADDILITRKGPVERVGVVVHISKTRSRLMVPDTVFRVRLLDNSTLLPSFVPLTLGCDAVQRDWFGRKVGLADAQVNVNHGILRQTKFPKPTKDEQLRIIELVAKARVRIQHERRSALKLAEMKNGLMQDLLTGKVRVNVNEEGGDE